MDCSWNFACCFCREQPQRTTEARAYLARSCCAAAGDHLAPAGCPSLLVQAAGGTYTLHPSSHSPHSLPPTHHLPSKYRFMESQTRDNRSRIVAKIPDITASLEAVEMLIAKRDAAQPVQTFFQLADNVFTQATVPPCDRVCLWLGANIMLEYSSDEACALLKSQVRGGFRGLRVGRAHTGDWGRRVMTPATRPPPPPPSLSARGGRDQAGAFHRGPRLPARPDHHRGGEHGATFQP